LNKIEDYTNQVRHLRDLFFFADYDEATLRITCENLVSSPRLWAFQLLAMIIREMDNGKGQ
jgi:hypothetical protein